MEAEIVKITEKKLSNLGNLTITGGPGRPLGSKNKFTMVKEALVDAFFDAEGQEAFKNTLVYEDLLVDTNGNKKKLINLEALRSVLRVLPREDLSTGNTYNFNLIVGELKSLRPEELRAIISSRPRNVGAGGGESLSPS